VTVLVAVGIEKTKLNVVNERRFWIRGDAIVEALWLMVSNLAKSLADFKGFSTINAKTLL
jgi:hypothetical protein